MPDPDWARELEWARERFPELRDFIVDVDMRPLLAWVPIGKEVTLYFRAEITRSNGTTDRYDCVASEATNATDSDGDSIALLVPGPEEVVQGQTVRDFFLANATRELVIFGKGGKQRKRADGTWEKFDEGTWGYRELGAYVGPVEGDAAHFQYGTAELGASCGPIVRESCEDGGIRDCNACTTIELTLLDYQRRRDPPPMQCGTPCPVVENPELERVQRLIKQIPRGYFPLPSRTSVALYRTREACETDPMWQEP